MICPHTLHPRAFNPRMIQFCFPHPDVFTYPYISSLKCRVRFVPDQTNCHKNAFFVTEFIDCVNFWSPFFPKITKLMSTNPWVSGLFVLQGITHLCRFRLGYDKQPTNTWVDGVLLGITDHMLGQVRLGQTAHLPKGWWRSYYSWVGGVLLGVTGLIKKNDTVL